MSKKLDQSLIDAYKAVYEEKRGHAAGSSDAEKQASQLASDVRYKAKGKVPQGATDEEKMKIFLQILGSSPAPSVVKQMAKDKLLGKKKTVKEAQYDNRYSDNTGEESKKKKEELRKKRGLTKAQMDKHPQFTRESKDTKAMKKYLEDKAERLKKKREKQSDAAKNNPHFDSTQPSPSGRNKYEEVEIGEAKKCWKGYKKVGTQKLFGKTYNRCEKEEFSNWRSEIEEGAAWTKKSGKNPEGGLNEKGRKSYERENPGSDLKAPSKKVGNKRRSSFCARMKGMKKKLTSAKTARDPDSRINKSLRKWNC